MEVHKNGGGQMRVWTLCKNMYGKRPLGCFIFGHDMVDVNGHARCYNCELDAKTEEGECQE